MQEIIEELVRSWAAIESPVNPTEEILKWIEERNRQAHVKIEQIPLSDMRDWYYDSAEGMLRNKKGTFFKICGFRAYEAECIVAEQPIIIQPENGYLGIICKKIGGLLHFLMQAKIEPGNINKIQLSPTIQATKSNFTRMHGGTQPAYLEYFLHGNKYIILLDQLQSEQSARFLKKRNRNMLILVDEPVKQLPSHRWMTLGQIKKLMCKYDNLVNMDTRTVLSSIPFSAVPIDERSRKALQPYFADNALFRSVFWGNEKYDLPQVYHTINNYKMFADYRYELCPLKCLDGWEFTNSGIYPANGQGFQVIYCNIEIEGREIKNWCQPLLQAIGTSTFALIFRKKNGLHQFLVHALPEPGCFDGIELGPSIQIDAALSRRGCPQIDSILHAPNVKRICDVMLSEEGGRFYHEQNRNVILEILPEQIGELPEGYFWLDYMTLNKLGQINNCLNIQLRNLLSLLRISQ